MAYMSDVYDTLEEAYLCLKAIEKLYHNDMSPLVKMKLEEVMLKAHIILKEREAINTAACARI
jgi:hypothetical protein